MKVIAKRLTRGDYATQPGGVVLSETESGYATHMFVRDPGSAEVRERFWGHYFEGRDQAHDDYQDRVATCRGYDTGGSLIPAADEERELRAERLAVAKAQFDRDGIAVLDGGDLEGLHDFFHSILGD